MGDSTIDALLAEVSSGMSDDLEALVAEHVDQQLAVFPALAADPALMGLMRTTIRETLTTEIDLITHGMDPAEVSAPPSVALWARRVAQRGYPMSSILRAYQLEHSVLMRQFVSRIDAVGSPRQDMVASILRINELSSELHQRVFLIRIAETYVAELERLAQTRAAAHKGRVMQLLDGSPAEVSEAERALGYPSRRRHVGLVARLSDGRTDPAALTASLVRLAATTGSAEPPLVALEDETTAWAWLAGAADPDALVAAAASASDEDRLLLAVGGAHEGLSGFRLTHIEALTAFAVLDAADPGAAVDAVTFAEAGVVGILTQNLPLTRSWVASVLGDLAADTPARARLRETLATFLQLDQSFVAAAARLTLHRNTVRYRVDQAKRLLPDPLAVRRADVELALRACRLLGRTVLVAG